MEPSAKSNNNRCRLLQVLEKNVTILRAEVRYSLRINHELESKLEWFNGASASLSDKLASLRSLADDRRRPVNNEIREFADQISASWTAASNQICKRYLKIRMASRTLPGVPLSVLLDRTRKEAIVARMSLRADEIACCRDHATKGHALLAEIAELLRRLEKRDAKVQEYLAVSKITPYLARLESALCKFAATVDLLPVKRADPRELDAFETVTKLLTGELLDSERVNPRQVLAENAPRKPVFIFKNSKRKVDAPAAHGSKISRGSPEGRS